MVKIVIHGLDELKVFSKRMYRYSHRISEDTVLQITDLLDRSIMMKAPVWTGELATSVETRRLSSNVFGIYMLDYGINLNEGKPFANVDMALLTEWVTDKFGYGPLESYHVAKDIAKKLRSVGPNPNPFIDAALEEVTPLVTDLLRMNYNRYMSTR